MPADDLLRRRYVEAGFEDDTWEEVTVPGHWQRHPVFSEEPGSMLHRVAFETEQLPFRARWWLIFDGVCAQSDVWLDSGYLGDTDLPFAPTVFEITDAASEGREHVLAVEVTNDPPGNPTAKRSVTGVYGGWDAMDSRRNVGGIWRPVRLETSGLQRLIRHRVVCTDATAERATLRCAVRINSTVETDVVLRTRVSGHEHLLEHPVARGTNDVEWEVHVANPDLWWPRALGAQPLHDLSVEVLGPDGTASDRIDRRIGFRTVELDDFVTRVNGERIFTKGAHHGPTGAWPAEVTDADARHDVQLALDTGLNLLRIQAHLAHPALYDAADEAGLLLWQDLPLRGGYHRSVGRAALRQATSTVETLGHHPSVAWWCGRDGDDGVGHDIPPLRRVVNTLRRQLPSPSTALLDRRVAATLRKADGSRPVIAQSGTPPRFPTLSGTDHPSKAGADGDVDSLWLLPARFAALPRNARFVSGFGSPHAEHRGAVIRAHVEALRRLKYRPTGGFTAFVLADLDDSGGWGLFDAQRRPQPGLDELREACAPLLPVLDPLPSHVHPGEQLSLDVHLVSDLRVDLDAVEVRAEVHWESGRRHHGWSGDVPADGVVRVGTLELTVPPVPGLLRVELTCHLHPGPTSTADNNERPPRIYETRIIDHHG